MKINLEKLNKITEEVKLMFMAPDMNFRILEPTVWVKKVHEQNDMHPVGTKCVVFASIRATDVGIKTQTAFFVMFEGDESPCFILKYKLEETDEKPEFI